MLKEESPEAEKHEVANKGGDAFEFRTVSGGGLVKVQSIIQLEETHVSWFALPVPNGAPYKFCVSLASAN
jgi:hypothetical protein